MSKAIDAILGALAAVALVVGSIGVVAFWVIAAPFLLLLGPFGWAILWEGFGWAVWLASGKRGARRKP